MSVSQVKKNFEEVASYLGRDVVGLEKLRKLKDAVNVLRTSLAAAAESEQRAIQCCEAAVAQSNGSKTSLMESRLECHRLQQNVDNLTKRLADATASNATDEEIDDDIPSMMGASNSAQFAATVRELRKHMKTCPPLVAKRGSTIVVNRSSIAKGWSRQDMWTLGASVALLSAFDGEVLVLSDEMIRELGDEKSKGEVIRWFSKNLSPIVSTPFDDVCAGMIEITPRLAAMGLKP